MKGQLILLVTIMFGLISCDKDSDKDQEPAANAGLSVAQLLTDGTALPADFRAGNPVAFDVENYAYAEENLTGVWAAFRNEGGTDLGVFCSSKDCNSAKFEMLSQSDSKVLRIVFPTLEKQAAGTYELVDFRLIFEDGDKVFFAKLDGSLDLLSNSESSEEAKFEETLMKVTSINLLNDNGDADAPQVVAFSTDKDSYKKGEVIKFTVNLAQKDETGIDWGAIYFNTLADEEYFFGTQYYTVEDEEENVEGTELVYEIQIPMNLPAGDYNLAQLTITDKVGNSFQGERDKQEAFSNTSVRIED